MESISITSNGGTKKMFLKIKFEVIESEDSMFGLKAVQGNEYCRTFDSLTGDRERINKLCAILDSSDISPIHIDDVIDDFLG